MTDTSALDRATRLARAAGMIGAKYVKPGAIAFIHAKYHEHIGTRCCTFPDSELRHAVDLALFT